MKKWLVLPADVFVDYIDNTMLLYNTTTFSSRIITNRNAIELISELRIPKNLGSIESTSKRIQILEIDKLISDDFVKIIENLEKPIVFLPIMNLQHDLDKDNINSTLSNMAFKTQLISGIFICLNLPFTSVSTKIDSDRYNAIRQSLISGISGNYQSNISFSDLDNIFSSLSITSIVNVDLILDMSNIQDASLLKLAEIANKYDYMIRLHSFIDGTDINNIFAMLNQCHKIKLFLYYDRHTNCFNHELADRLYAKYKDLLVINKFLYTENDIIESDIINLIPVFSKEGMLLFKNNVFLTPQDIFNNHVSMKEIMRNKKINANFFGLLDITPDGKIYPHGGIKSIGNIFKENYLLNAITRELIENNSWRITRDKTACHNCCFRYICPSVSIVELLFSNLKICL